MANSDPMVKLEYSKLEQQVGPLVGMGHLCISIVIEWATVATVVSSSLQLHCPSMGLLSSLLFHPFTSTRALQP